MNVDKTIKETYCEHLIKKGTSEEKAIHFLNEFDKLIKGKSKNFPCLFLLSATKKLFRI